MRKLLGQTPATTNESIDTSSLGSPQLRPSASQNTVFTTRAAVACLDRSPDGQRAVIAGQKIFKTLRIDGSTITEDIDLRTLISTYAASHDITAATADQFNIRAVKWLHTELDTTIITACGNGRITLYDLNRVGEGLEVARIQEHTRQVHKLDINPFRSNWVLSASQDGTVKSFDLRSPVNGRSGLTFRSWHTFKCNADAVRDVKWSPTDGFDFACSTDAGLVQKWDARRPGAPILKITAHQNACFSIAWHPDGDHLVSGGTDQFCHVWDVSKTADRGQKPRYSFRTPAPISSVSWRPPCWSATAKGKRAAQLNSGKLPQQALCGILEISCGVSTGMVTSHRQMSHLYHS
jgi:WD40 repeat protein